MYMDKLFCYWADTQYSACGVEIISVIDKCRKKEKYFATRNRVLNVFPTDFHRFKWDGKVLEILQCHEPDIHCHLITTAALIDVIHYTSTYTPHLHGVDLHTCVRVCEADIFLFHMGSTETWRRRNVNGGLTHNTTPAICLDE